MANLFNNDIGLNYKGIINIGATINQNVSSSLQSLTDGDGNNLPLQLATNLMAVDGGTIAFTTGTNTRNVLTQTYTLNNTGGTNTVRGIFLNATETAIVGTTHNLLELQVGGVNQFRVNRLGAITTAGSYITFNNNATILFGVDATGFLYYQNANKFYVTNAGLIYGYNDFRNTGNAFIGSIAVAPTARLHVRGDGTNSIARLENSDGSYRQLINLTQQVFNVTSGGTFSIRPNEGTTNNPGFDFQVYIFGGGAPIMKICSRYSIGAAVNNSQTGLIFSNLDNIATGNFRNNFLATGFSITNTTGTSGGIQYVDTFAAAAGAGNYRPLSIAYTINNTGAQTGVSTGIFLNATETNLNSMTHNLMDLQVGGVSKFLILNTGAIGSTASSIGLFGATPIAQPTTGIASATTAVGVGTPITEDTTFAGYTVAQIAQALVNLGILKP